MPTINCGPTHGGPTTEHGKAIASRNATTHGLFARDIVLPSLGEDPEGYRQVQDEWTQQLAPRNLLEQHYVEKIAAASWRLRRLHRWQAQIFEDAALTEDERLGRLDKVLRHETALQRQIDTAVKLLARDVPQLYQRRLRDQVLQDLNITERECRDEPETDLGVSLETSNRLYRLRKATNQAVNELSVAPLDPVAEAEDSELCQNEPASTPISSPFPNRGGQALVPEGVLTPPLLGAGGSFLTPLSHSDGGGAGGGGEICQNEPAARPALSPAKRRFLAPPFWLPAHFNGGRGRGAFREQLRRNLRYFLGV